MRLPDRYRRWRLGDPGGNRPTVPAGGRAAGVPAWYLHRVVLIAVASAWLVACSVPHAPGTPDAAASVTPAQDAGASDSPVVPAPAKMLPAVMTQVHGDVTIAEPTDDYADAIPDASVRPARHLALVAPGSSVRVGAGSSAGLICADEHWVELIGPLVWTLSDATCRDGKDLEPGTYAKLAPRLGRVYTIQDHQALQPETLEAADDYGRKPVILSPRNSALLAVEPDISWSAVEDAAQYVLSLNGAETYTDVVLDAATVNCTNKGIGASGSMCTTPWPTETWGELARGQIYFLVVGGRASLLSPLQASEPSVLRVLSGVAASELTAQISSIKSLGLDPMTTDLLIATTLVARANRLGNTEEGVYAEAISLLEHVAAKAPSPELYVTLGDVYRTVDLQRCASRSYTEALDLLESLPDDVAIRAAAEFGLGQVAYVFQDFAAAELHFECALELYRMLGAEEELQASTDALEATRARLE